MFPINEWGTSMSAAAFENVENEELALHRTANDAATDLANRIANIVRDKPDAVLGLATGGTMEPVYEALIAMNRDGLSFAGVRSFNLDEYLGLDPTHPMSYRATMHRIFFDHVDILPENTHLPNGTATDLTAESAAYENAIRQTGGIDLQILGIGRNGHIGFNEPGSTVNSRTRVVTLAPDTISANSRFFNRTEEQPVQAITMGLGTILEARQIAILATGKSKARALDNAMRGPVTPDCPASFLQDHKSVSWIADNEAADLL